MRRAAPALAALLFAGVLLLVSFVVGGPDDEPAAVAPEPSSSPSPQAGESEPSEPPWETLRGPLARCGPQPVALADADLRVQTLRDAVVGRIPTVVAGRGRSVAVLLHQTDGNGLCGWLEHVPALVAEPGVAVLAVDVCPYGAARCAEDVEPTEVIAAAVRHARTAMRADRIVLVGASMGGSLALIGAASLPGIDAAVDLSGPTDWPGMEQVRKGRAIRVPVLVAMSELDEGPDQVAVAQAITRRAPAGSRYLAGESGHGYDLVEPFLPELHAWIVGR